MIACQINAFITKGKNNLSIRGEKVLCFSLHFTNYYIIKIAFICHLCTLRYMYVHIFDSHPGHGSSFSSFGFEFMFLQNEVTNCMTYCLMCEVVYLLIAHLNLYTSHCNFLHRRKVFKSGIKRNFVIR